MTNCFDSISSFVFRVHQKHMSLKYFHYQLYISLIQQSWRYKSQIYINTQTSLLCKFEIYRVFKNMLKWTSMIQYLKLQFKSMFFIIIHAFFIRIYFGQNGPKVKNTRFFFIRIYFIRILRLKMVQKLRIS